MTSSRKIKRTKPPKGMEKWTDDFGTEYFVHSRARCSGSCPLHNPSDHSMSHWKLSLRPEKGAIVERHCPECGAGQPDPDSLRHLREIGVAGSYTFMMFGYSTCCEENKK